MGKSISMIYWAVLGGICQCQRISKVANYCLYFAQMDHLTRIDILNLDDPGASRRLWPKPEDENFPFMYR